MIVEANCIVNQIHINDCSVLKFYDAKSRYELLDVYKQIANRIDEVIDRCFKYKQMSRRDERKLLMSLSDRMDSKYKFYALLDEIDEYSKPETSWRNIEHLDLNILRHI
jgi:hypothetical protein